MYKKFKYIIFQSIIIWLVFAFLSIIFVVNENRIANDLMYICLAVFPWIFRSYIYLKNKYEDDSFIRMIVLVALDTIIMTFFGLIVIFCGSKAVFAIGELGSYWTIVIYFGGLVYLGYLLVISFIVMFTIIILKLFRIKMIWKRVFFISATIMLIFFGTGNIYKMEHPTYYKYKDKLIIGQSLEDVEKRYGKFDYEREGDVGYYIYERGDKYYYVMYYNDNVVTRVAVEPERGR